MASHANLELIVSVRWWVRPLISVIGCIYRCTGWSPEPDWLTSILTRYGLRMVRA